MKVYEDPTENPVFLAGKEENVDVGGRAEMKRS